MIECSRHINLVKVPAENSDLLLTRAIQDASYQRRVLLRRLVEILEADHLARLAFANVGHYCYKLTTAVFTAWSIHFQYDCINTHLFCLTRNNY